MTNTRDKLYRMGRKMVTALAARDGGAREVEGTNNALENSDGAATLKAGDYSRDKSNPVQVDNPGPDHQVLKAYPGRWQRRINKYKKWYKSASVFISRVAATIWELRPWRELTEIEKQKKADEIKRAKEYQLYYREGREMAKRASRAYKRMGLYYEPPLHKKSFINGEKLIRFSHIVADPNAIWLKIDTAHLPHKVDILQAVNDERILTNISAALAHHVEGRYHVIKGAWLCVERGRGVRGIPQIVNYRKMINLIPTNMDSFTIPFGETVNARRIYRSLKTFPHMLVGGATGQGKTSFLNVILAALIERNTPQELELILVDLKNGVEFEYYKGLPHLKPLSGIAPGGIVGRNQDVIPLLKRLIEMGENRLEIFVKAGVTNIKDFNKHKRRGRMPRLVIVFDEWARVALRDGGKEADELLSEITATYRAVGFHVILATQTPIVRVVSTLIKTNFAARLAFGVPQLAASQVILNNGRAKGLSPRGRAIFQMGITEVETQVPYIEKPELLKIIKDAKDNAGATEQELSLLDIARYCLDHLGGDMTVEKVYRHFQGKIARVELADRLKTLDGSIVDVDGTEYVVKPSNGGAVPRRLVEYKKQIPGVKGYPPPPAPDPENIE